MHKANSPTEQEETSKAARSCPVILKCYHDLVVVIIIIIIIIIISFVQGFSYTDAAQSALAIWHTTQYKQKTRYSIQVKHKKEITQNE